LTTKKNLTVDGIVFCNLSENEVKQGILTGINFVIEDGAEFNKNSFIVSNGHIQIVESPDLLLKTGEDFKKAFNEVAMDSGEGIRVGPLFAQAPSRTSDFNVSSLALNTNAILGEATDSGKAKKDKKVNFRGKIKIGISVGSPDQPFPTWMDLEKVPKILDYILLWAKMPNGVLNIEDAYLFTPDGHDGEDIIGGCDINVPQIESPEDQFKRNAMRMRGHARVIRVNNFHLYLGDGGKGGDATTDKNCNPGKAVAGIGGNPSNFKWTADEAIEILGGFYIYPGRGGDGGKAIAYGADGIDGCTDREAINGKNAYATGGAGAANPRVLSAKGGVQGLSNIYIGSMYGGNGGDAEVNPGKGGNANKCDCPGGKGGDGFATPGRGGEVSLRYPAGVQRIPGSIDEKGKDGQGGTASGLPGQDGPKCPGNNNTNVVDTVSKPTPKDNATSKKTGFFEFIDLSTGQKVDYISGIKPHIIVATSGDPDVRNWLPIRLELKVNGDSVWNGKIEGDPSVVCRGSTGCSMDGPNVTTEFNSITLTAYSNNGQAVAIFSEKK
ncbi:hypothetical protein HY407_01600, partial [Candidatus Gottesmanbacteria bacterium]|nr:hypothetical protein [Candidatus Gottesmanbacteria bacterium]